MSNYDFSGKVAFVSGAGRGFGRRVSEKLAEGGAKLVVTDFSDELVDGTVEAISATGADICGLSGDIADEATSRRCAGLISEVHGGLDIAINNAGIAQPHTRLHEMESAVAEKIVAVDLMGVFYAMKHQIPLMLKRVEEGSGPCTILNVASAAGLMGSPQLAAYSAAKAGVIGLTRTAAVEYGRKGIRVNCVCPAFTKTDMVIPALDASPHGREKAEAKMVSFNPMQRLGEVDEVVAAMLWAVSPDNSFFNGQALAIDGGLSA